jgi:hypothetical protein
MLHPNVHPLSTSSFACPEFHEMHWATGLNRDACFGRRLLRGGPKGYVSYSSHKGFWPVPCLPSNGLSAKNQGEQRDGTFRTLLNSIPSQPPLQL